MIKVTLESNLSPTLLRGVRDAVERTMEAAAPQMVAQARAQWTGWKYEGRPSDAPRDVSQKAWLARMEDGVLVLSNDARDYRYGRAYVTHVRRRKGAEEEWRVLQRNLEESALPALTDALGAAVEEAWNG